MISHRLRLVENNLRNNFAEECVPIRGLRTDLRFQISLFRRRMFGHVDRSGGPEPVKKNDAGQHTFSELYSSLKEVGTQHRKTPRWLCRESNPRPTCIIRSAAGAANHRVTGPTSLARAKFSNRVYAHINKSRI